MRAVVVCALVVVACSEPPKPASVAPVAPVAPAPAEDDHADDAPNDGKDHRALYVDRVVIGDRNFVVDAAGALDDGGGAAYDNAAKKLPATTTYKSVVVDGRGLLVGGADGSLHYAASKDGPFVVVRDPRE